MAFLLSLSTFAQDISGLLPSNEELPGWKRDAVPGVYSGDNLFELINGGADIYFEYGFVQVVSAKYTDPYQNHIQVELYEMNDSSAAYGIFGIMQQSVAWSDDFGSISAVTENYIAFWKSKYYVIVSWSSRQHIDKPMLADIATKVSGKIPDERNYPELVADFFEFDVPANKIYLKGNLALSNFYYFDYKDIFMIEDGIAWSTDSYHSILFNYKNQELASETLNSVRQSILNSKRFSDVASVFRGFNCTDNKGNLILLRQVENFLLILIRRDKSISLEKPMDLISMKIEGLSN